MAEVQVEREVQRGWVEGVLLGAGEQVHAASAAAAVPVLVLALVRVRARAQDLVVLAEAVVSAGRVAAVL